MRKFTLWYIEGEFGVNFLICHSQNFQFLWPLPKMAIFNLNWKIRKILGIHPILQGILVDYQWQSLHSNDFYKNVEVRLIVRKDDSFWNDESSHSLMSHRENGIGFLHLRTLSIQVQVSFEHEIHFWTDSKFSKLEKFNFRFSNSKKRRKVFFYFSDPHFGQLCDACQKLQFSLRAFSKWKKHAEWRFLTIREEKSNDMEIF